MHCVSKMQTLSQSSASAYQGNCFKWKSKFFIGDFNLIGTFSESACAYGWAQVSVLSITLNV